MRLVILACLLALPLPAHAAGPIAEVICSPSEAMTERLTRQLGSVRTASGLRNPEEVVEIWTAPRGDWTMVIRYASGKSCIVAMGQDWQAGGT